MLFIVRFKRSSVKEFGIFHRKNIVIHLGIAFFFNSLEGHIIGINVPVASKVNFRQVFFPDLVKQTGIGNDQQQFQGFPGGIDYFQDP